MIDSGAYPMEAPASIQKMYLPQDLGHATEKNHRAYSTG